MWLIKVLIIVVVLYLSYGYIPTLIVRSLWKKPEEMEGVSFILSFDDGPSYVTKDLIELLESHRIKGYFFLLGSSVKDIDINSIYKDHEVGLHGYNHINYAKTGPIKTRRELLKGLDALKSQGIKPRYFRSPYGLYNIYQLYLLKKHNLKIVQWDYLLNDWEDNEDGVLLDRLRRYGKDNNLLVLHDGTEGTAYLKAKDKMIVELREFLDERDIG